MVKIQNARQGSFSGKIQGFSAESESIDSSLQAVNIRARVNDDFSFPGLFGTGTFSQVAGVLRRLERVFRCTRARNLHTPLLRCTRQRNESKSEREE